MRIYPKQGYRKWWLGAAALVFSTLLAALGKVSGPEYATIIGLIVGLGGFSNVGEHWAKNRPGADDRSSTNNT